MDLPRARKPSGRAANGLLAAGSVVAALALLLAVDRVLGWWLPSDALAAGLLFPPRAEVRYETLEFSYGVDINNLGFRGPDTMLAKSDALRVVALGDSNVYGWGVETEDTWLALLQDAWRRDGRRVEILNLGAPGFHPGQYADVAERVLPELEPDVVLVGLLQDDDLRQVAEHPVPAPEPRPLALRAVAALFPNLTRLATRERERRVLRSANVWKFLNADWRRQARARVTKLGPAARERFESADPAVREGFLAGRINPALLNLYFRGGKPPDDELRLESPRMQRRIEAAAAALRRIADAARAVGARVVAVSVPHPAFTSPAAWESMRALGRPSRPEELTTQVPDRAAAEACARAAIPFVEVTPAFRTRAREEVLFYPVDGHLNRRGNAVFAGLLAVPLGTSVFGAAGDPW